MRFGSFSKSIASWSKRMTNEQKRFQKAAIFDLFGSVIEDTPVLEGRLRANWILTEGRPGDGTTDDTDPNGNATIAKMQAALATVDFRKDTEVFLTNNLPYANRIEYDGWSHTKAPAGMVRKNLIRVQANLQEA